MWSVIVALVESTVCSVTIVDVKRACGLSDDDALNFFFKKTLFAPAFPQMKVTTTTAEKFSVLMARTDQVLLFLPLQVVLLYHTRQQLVRCLFVSHCSVAPRFVALSCDAPHFGVPSFDAPHFYELCFV